MYCIIKLAIYAFILIFIVNCNHRSNFNYWLNNSNLNIEPGFYPSHLKKTYFINVGIICSTSCYLNYHQSLKNKFRDNTIDTLEALLRFINLKTYLHEPTIDSPWNFVVVIHSLKVWMKNKLNFDESVSDEEVVQRFRDERLDSHFQNIDLWVLIIGNKIRSRLFMESIDDSKHSFPCSTDMPILMSVNESDPNRLFKQEVNLRFMFDSVNDTEIDYWDAYKCWRDYPSETDLSFIYVNETDSDYFVGGKETCDHGLTDSYCKNFKFSNANISCTFGTCCYVEKSLSMFLPNTYVCRPPSADNMDCDIAEKCTGLSPFCPVDKFKENGQSCKESHGKYGRCFNGVCKMQFQTCNKALELIGRPNITLRNISIIEENKFYHRTKINPCEFVYCPCENCIVEEEHIHFWQSGYQTVLKPYGRDFLISIESEYSKWSYESKMLTNLNFLMCDFFEDDTMAGVCFNKICHDTYKTLAIIAHGFDYMDAVAEHNCGNFRVDQGEDCDCGPFEQCLSPENLCCDPSICKFLPEHSSCDFDTGYCVRSICNSHDTQCKMLFGPLAKTANLACYEGNSEFGLEIAQGEAKVSINKMFGCGLNLQTGSIGNCPSVKINRGFSLCGNLMCEIPPNYNHTSQKVQLTIYTAIPYIDYENVFVSWSYEKAQICLDREETHFNKFCCATGGIFDNTSKNYKPVMVRQHTKCGHSKWCINQCCVDNSVDESDTYIEKVNEHVCLPSLGNHISHEFEAFLKLFNMNSGPYLGVFMFP